MPAKCRRHLHRIFTIRMCNVIGPEACTRLAHYMSINALNSAKVMYKTGGVLPSCMIPLSQLADVDDRIVDGPVCDIHPTRLWRLWLNL